MHIDKTYEEMVEYILSNGELRTNRTGIDTIAVFGYQFKHDLRLGFPLLTTKKVAFNSVVKELLWFLRGETNIKTLGCGIWNEWADEEGNCGPIYGKQWVSWEVFEPFMDDYRGNISHVPQVEGYNLKTINQIQQAIDTIKTNPESRRIIVSAWNVADLSKMCLNPCHVLFQFNVSGSFLDLQMYQRSADCVLGFPFNVASYALLLTMVAKECNLTPRYFIHTFGDLHIYINHLEGIKEQMTRSSFSMTTLKVENKSFWNIRETDISLLNYQHHPAIKFEVAI